MIDYRENAVWTVYIHIIPKEISDYDYDKYYVGITSKKPEHRWGSRGQNYDNIKQNYFYLAIQKYGWNNILHEIVASHLTESEAKEMEIALIAKLGSHGKYGYNLTDGGDGTVGTPWTDEQRELSKKREYKKGEDSPFSIPIYQFDENRNFVNRYVGINETARRLNITQSTITSSITDHRYKKGYIWLHEEDVVIEDGKYAIPEGYIVSENKKHVPVYQFTIEGQFIKKYNSIVSASRETNVSIGVISNRIKSDNTIYALDTNTQYIWRKEEDVYEENGTYFLKGSIDIKYKIKPVCCFNKKTQEFIQRYDNSAEASIDTGINRATILNSASNFICDSNSPYIFRYEMDVQKDSNKGYRLNPDDSSMLKKTNKKTIYQFNRETRKYIATYESIVQASRITKIPESSILHILNNERLTSNSQYIWRREEDVIFDGNDYQIEEMDWFDKYYHSGMSKRVFQFDVYGNYINDYYSAEEASRQNKGYSSKMIRSSAAKHKLNKNGIYHFRYLEDVQESEENPGSFIMLR